MGKLSNAVISDIYTIDPNKVKYDLKFVDFNERKSESSYASLLSQIRENGQLRPIYIRNGLVIDGYHRCKVAKELSIQVNAVDIDSALSDEDAIVLCNDNIFGSRNNSATQLAIKAHDLVEQFGISDAKAIELTGLKDKKAIGYVRRIKASKYDKEFNILATLLQGEAVKFVNPIDDTVFRSKSVDKVKRVIAKIEEYDLLPDNGGLTIPDIDYDAMLDTETAKEYFWSNQSNITTSETKLLFIGLLNKVYQINEPKAEDFIKAYIKSINKPVETQQEKIDRILLGGKKHQLSDDEANRLVAERKAITDKFVD